jgi:ANTAR domain-containing protein
MTHSQVKHPTHSQVKHPASAQLSGDGQCAGSAPNPDAAIGLRGDGASPLTEDLVAELTGLRRRLDTLPIIEQSKGILIGYFGIDADTAFNVLRRWSSHTNIKLRDISQLLVDAASTPPRPGQPPRSALDHLITRLQTRDSPAKHV